MKSILCIFLSMSYSSSHASTRVQVTDADLAFQYQSNDGEISLLCTHGRIRDLPDWEVVCGKGTPLLKKFAVHFVMNRGQRQGAPREWYEVLYWVTERQERPRFSSTSITINLNEASPVHSLRLFQSVENDYASLSVDVSIR